jgi:hypothetical protein
MPGPNKYFVIGLPEAGKTTFLAAFYHVVESGHVPGSLRLNKVEGDMKHLNRIRGAWIDVTEIGRTVAPEEVTLLLDGAETDTVEVHLPDLSGESFRTQWKDRRMAPQVAAFLRESLGGLLLLHPATIKEETLIRDAEPIVDIVASAPAVQGQLTPTDGNIIRPTTPTAKEPEEIKPYDLDDAPTQVKLVELLQFVVAQCPHRPLKLSVIISAWDIVSTRGDLLPVDWIKERLPLLWQFLRANGETFKTSYYGVSAQGGPLSAAESLRKLKPVDRIAVVDGNGRHSHDITAPIRTIME